MIRKNSFRDEMNSDPAQPFKTMVETALPMQVDCVAWNYKYDVIAVGAYELDKTDTSIRKGFIYLIELDPRAQSGFKYVQQKSTPGVLDLKWEPNKQTTLAVGTSNSILIFQVDLVGGKPMLEVTHEVDLTTMVLFVQWISESRVIFSDSAGYVSILDAKSEEAPEIVVTNQLHDFLVWVVHVNVDMNCVFSGADDGKFFAFHIEDLMEPVRHFKKTFDVGVTSIITKDDLVAIGCYDDKLRIYTIKMDSFEDTDSEIRKISLVHRLEMHLGGAVWRTIWLPYADDSQEHDKDEYRIAVAAARNGVHIVSLNKSSWTWQTNLVCKKHEGSLAYGLDIKVDKSEKTYTVASCYFDNHMLHVFKFGLD